MAKVTIGDRDYLIPELNFIAMEKAWSAIQETMNNPDPVQAVGSAIEIIGAALQEAPDFSKEDFGINPAEALTGTEIDVLVSHYLKRQLKASQIRNVQIALDDILQEAGLRPEPGELKILGLSPGTETPAPSSQVSSQQESKEAAGIA